MLHSACYTSLLMPVYSDSSEVHAWPWPWCVTDPPQFPVALCASSSRACPVLLVLRWGRSQASDSVCVFGRDSCSVTFQCISPANISSFVFIFLFLINVWLIYIPNILFFWKYCFPLSFVFIVLKYNFYCICFCFRISLYIMLSVFWQSTCPLKLFGHS